MMMLRWIAISPRFALRQKSSSESNSATRMRSWECSSCSADTCFARWMPWWPKDVWLINMENCGNVGSLMDSYAGITGRDLMVMPRIDDDGCELHMQLNAGMYDRR